MKNGTLKFPHQKKTQQHDLASTSNLLDIGHGSLVVSPEKKVTRRTFGTWRKVKSKDGDPGSGGKAAEPKSGSAVGGVQNPRGLSQLLDFNKTLKETNDRCCKESMCHENICFKNPVSKFCWEHA